MKCPFCGYEDTKVIDSRTQNDNCIIRRRRSCEKCLKRFTTYEKVEIIPLYVIKRNGTREEFDRQKLQSGIMKSCNKRKITIEEIEGIVDDIETSVLNALEKEIETKEIGEMVMERLKLLDETAYVRFASVYRQFKDINTFMDELTKLIDEKNAKT